MIKSKVSYNDIVPKEYNFPLFARYKQSGCVVLFTSEDTGTLLVQGSSQIHKIGHHSDAWIPVNDIHNTWEVLPKGTVLELTQE